MRRSLSLIGVCLLLLTAACAQPTTLIPKASPQEVKQEQQRMLHASHVAPLPPIVEPVKRSKAMDRRLQHIATKIMPHATHMCSEIFGQEVKKACHFRLELSTKKGANAYADGEKVVVTTAMMELAKEDTQLAFVLAHELAHNVMEHPQRSQGNVIIGAIVGGLADAVVASQGMRSEGEFSRAGAYMGTLAYSPAFELEADYIGLYILARAGYDITKAPSFWRSLAQYNPNSLYTETTHPTSPERYVTMQKVIAEIKDKQKSHVALMPEFMRNEEVMLPEKVNGPARFSPALEYRYPGKYGGA